MLLQMNNNMFSLWIQASLILDLRNTVKSRNCILVQFLSSPSLIVIFYSLFTDNELMYQTREGDVVKLNADTKEKTVIVPKLLFVSIILPTVYFKSCKCALDCYHTGCLTAVSVCFWSHPGQIQSHQVPSISRHAACVVCLWSKTGEKPSEFLRTPYHFSRRCPSLTVTLFVSTDLPTLLCGQVHYLQPRGTVRLTSVLSSFIVCRLAVPWLSSSSHRPLTGQYALSLTSCGKSTDVSPIYLALACHVMGMHLSSI